MTPIDDTKIYIQYAKDVLSGKEVAGKLIKLACKRMLDWFDRDDLYFDYKDTDAKIRFVSKFKLTESPFTGQPFILLPYQQWIFANIYGFKYIENGAKTDKRVIKNALLLMARKQGKTQLAAALMLATLVMDGQTSVTGYTIANSGEQASLAFKHITDLCESVDPKQKIFYRGKARIIKNIEIPLTKSRIRVLNSDTSKLDGLNPQIFIQDEAHAAKTNNIWGVMKTGMGVRHNALAICISTTGFLVGDDYPLYAQWNACKKTLEGAIDDDSWFPALYQVDEDDDWKDETIWKKACPSLGVTMSIDSLRADFQNALSNPSMEIQFKTKQLNMWVQTSATWLTIEEIKDVTQPFELTDFDPEEDYCYVGVDIAERSDLCVLSTLVYKDDKRYFKAYPFICERALERSKNKELYQKWVRGGYLELIKGESIDLDLVIQKLWQINDQLPIAVVAYDSWHAQQLRVKCEKEGIPIKAVQQSIAQFTDPTNEFEHLVLTKQCIIDDNPVTRWCFANVSMVTDHNGNRKPDKETPANKIDIVIAFIQSLKLFDEINPTLDSDLEPFALDG